MNVNDFYKTIPAPPQGWQCREAALSRTGSQMAGFHNVILLPLGRVMIFSVTERPHAS
jgi:hypothetical protein